VNVTTQVALIVAVKRIEEAKTRLAPSLPPTIRASLVLAMLADVVGAAIAVPAVYSVTVVTPDDSWQLLAAS
jgi:2-phospho-L-lactate guanylyltransferase